MQLQRADFSDVQWAKTLNNASSAFYAADLDLRVKIDPGYWSNNTITGDPVTSPTESYSFMFKNVASRVCIRNDSLQLLTALARMFIRPVMQTVA